MLEWKIQREAGLRKEDFELIKGDLEMQGIIEGGKG